MFQQGTAEPMPYTKKLLAVVGQVIDTLPNRVSISGHTSGNDTGDSWELSSSRANAARALLQGGGLSSDRIYEVAGKAASEPLLPEDPSASANRRLSIVLDARGSSARACPVTLCKKRIFARAIARARIPYGAYFVARSTSAWS